MLGSRLVEHCSSRSMPYSTRIINSFQFAAKGECIGRDCIGGGG